MCSNARVGCAAVVAHPEAGVAGDVQLAVRIVRQAMTAGLVVRARSLHGRVVLRHVKIERPRPQRARHRLQRLIERLRRWSSRTPPAAVDPRGRCTPSVNSSVCAMSAWKPSVFGRSTCSSSSRFRFQLCMPPQQISPSAASRSPNPSATVARLAEGLRDLLRVAVRVLRPLRRARGRIDPDDAGLSNARRHGASCRSRRPSAPA